MFKNYLSVAFRNIIKQKLYSLINIGGLAIGLAACILMLLFVREEVSYDKWIPNVDQLHLVEVMFTPPGRPAIGVALTSGFLAPALADNFPEMEETIRIFNDSTLITQGDRSFQEKVSFADPNLFEVFDLPMVEGDRELGVSDNSSLLLSEEMAKKYFGTTSPIGKSLTLNKEKDFTIVGVFKDIPENTHFDMDFIGFFDVSRYDARPWIAQSWGSTTVSTYIKLKKGVSQSQIEEQFPDFINNRVVIEIPDMPDLKLADMTHFNLLPVKDIYLFGDKMDHQKPGGDIMVVITFSTIAGLILIIASINFMNLATARSMQRAREVSMRKVLGASRKQLIGQFLSEAILTTLIGLTLALVLTELSLPLYNSFLGKELSLDIIGDPTQTAGLLSLTLFVGIIGGSYPAFFLSNFRPAKILKANKSSDESSGTLRNFLVVLQFSISITLIVVTGIVYGQTYFAQNQVSGFEKKNKLTIQVFDPSFSPLIKTLMTELKNLPGVNDVTQSGDQFPQTGNTSYLMTLPGHESEPPLIIEKFTIGPNFLQLFNIKPLAGRLFSEDYRSDYRVEPEDESISATQSIIVNETFLSKAGFGSPEEAIDQILIGKDGQTTDLKIVGVIPDINTRNLHMAISPIALIVSDNKLGYLTLDLKPENLAETLAGIDQVWTEIVPEAPINRSFVEDNFKALYAEEEKQSQMFAAFALFAVFVSCLGLYALASFAAQRRTKEIGIRKVLGASVMDIVKLLVWQFSKPVIWANLIAWPIAFYAMQDWLNGFEYRISMNPLLFVGAGLTALLIAWITVAGRATKVARTNPINALRYE